MSNKPERGADIIIKRDVVEGMKEFAYEKAPEPQQDWDLIWVISGPPMDISEDFREDHEVLVGYNDKIAKNDVVKKINESRERFLTGLRVAKAVTAKRLGKDADAVTSEEIKESGPDIFWNATDWGNDNLRQRIGEGFLDQYDFPKEKVIVSENLGIEHTGHQFERLDENIIAGRRKVVIVSDVYHLPRIQRYINIEGDKISEDMTVLYPSEPRRVPVGKGLAEVRKIPNYIEKGILPKE